MACGAAPVQEAQQAAAGQADVLERIEFWKFREDNVLAAPVQDQVGMGGVWRLVYVAEEK